MDGVAKAESGTRRVAAKLELYKAFSIRSTAPRSIAGNPPNRQLDGVRTFFSPSKRAHAKAVSPKCGPAAEVRWKSACSGSRFTIGTEWHKISPGAHSNTKPPAYVQAAVNNSRFGSGPTGGVSVKRMVDARPMRTTTEAPYATTKVRKPV